jgi:predicted transcriptional regulator
VNSLSSTVNSLEWRRSKVLELSSQGHSQPEIARILQISQPTVNRDIGYLRGQARQNLQKHIQDKLPEEYQNCMTGINQVLKICWEIVNKSRNVNNDNGNQTVTMTDNKTVLQALALINDCNKYKMDLTTNGVVITDALKFVQTNKEKLTTMYSKEDNGSKESKEPDYDEDKDQLEEKQEEETGEIEKGTTNQVF